LNKIMPYILAIILAFILFLIYKIVIRVLKIITRKRILSSGNYTVKSAEALIYTLFPSRYIISNVYLPYKSADGQRIFAKADHVIITKSSIAVVSIRGESGQIQSDDDSMWFRFDLGKKTQMRNPIKENQRNIAILKRVLQKNQIADIDFSNMVVFTSSRIRFSQRQAEIFAPAHAADHLMYISQHKKIKLLQREKLRKIIKKFKK